MSKAEEIVLWMLAIYILFRCLCALAGWLAFSETDFEKETRCYYQRLLDAKKIPDESKRMMVLDELAIEVGAGTEHTLIGTPFRVDENIIDTRQTPIAEADLCNNIHRALQTRYARSAQERAAKSDQIAFLALLIALGSGLVSFFALRSTSRMKKEKLAQ
ncbi:MAG: hypothetical protein ACYTAO_06250 [Planctomycetota bacterium]|jgi:hypothetical protein